MSEDNGKRLAKKRFKNRMGLAWTSLIAMIVLTILLWFFVPDNRLEIAAGMSPYLYFAFTSIVGAAMGLKTWSEKK